MRHIGDVRYFNVVEETGNGSYEWLTDAQALKVDVVADDLKVMLGLAGPPVRMSVFAKVAQLQVIAGPGEPLRKVART